MEPTTTAAAATQAGAGMHGFLFIFIAFALVFMFLSSRSQKKREAQQKKVIQSLSKGEKVVLIGGVIGTIAGFNGELIEVKVAEGVKLSVLPSGIVTVYNENKQSQTESNKK